MHSRIQCSKEIINLGKILPLQLAINGVVKCGYFGVWSRACRCVDIKVESLVGFLRKNIKRRLSNFTVLEHFNVIRSLKLLLLRLRKKNKRKLLRI
jgi:hypothetical protein